MTTASVSNGNNVPITSGMVDNLTTTLSPIFTDVTNSSLPENVTETLANITTTTLSQLPGCVFQNGKWKCPEKEYAIPLDTYLIVACVCFALGAVLLSFGIIRLVWFISSRSPTKETDHGKFKYILRLMEANEKGTHGYNDYVDNPALWY